MIVSARVDQYHIGTMIHLVILSLAGDFAEGRIEARSKAVNIQKIAGHTDKIGIEIGYVLRELLDIDEAGGTTTLVVTRP